MSAFLLDEITHDRVRANGQFVRVSGAEEAKQLVKVRSLILLSEVFLNTSAGVDYFGLVFVRGTPIALINQEFTEVTQSVPGLVNVVLTVAFDDTIVVAGGDSPQFIVTWSADYDSDDQTQRRRIQGEFRVEGEPV